MFVCFLSNFFSSIVLQPSSPWYCPYVGNNLKLNIGIIPMKNCLGQHIFNFGTQGMWALAGWQWEWNSTICQGLSGTQRVATLSGMRHISPFFLPSFFNFNGLFIPLHFCSLILIYLGRASRLCELKSKKTIGALWIMRTGNGHSWRDGKRGRPFLVRTGCNHLHFFPTNNVGCFEISG